MCSAYDDAVSSFWRWITDMPARWENKKRIMKRKQAKSTTQRQTLEWEHTDLRQKLMLMMSGVLVCFLKFVVKSSPGDPLNHFPPKPSPKSVTIKSGIDSLIFELENWWPRRIRPDQKTAKTCCEQNHPIYFLASIVPLPSSSSGKLRNEQACRAEKIFNYLSASQAWKPCDTGWEMEIS